MQSALPSYPAKQIAPDSAEWLDVAVVLSCLILGAQTVFSSFFLSMLALPRRDPPVT